MISWIEKRNVLCWTITIILAVMIFYVSSLSFEGSSAGGYGINAILYHILVFFFFTLFLLMSLVGGRKKELILVAFLVAFSYGVVDEIHQLFVPGRVASLTDVMFDGIGISFVSVIYSINLNRRKKIKSKQ